MNKIVYISEREQLDNNLINMEYALESVKRCFDIMRADDYIMSGSNGNSHGNRLWGKGLAKKNLFISMPAYLGGEYGCFGIKWHGPNRHIDGKINETNYILIINDGQTGEPKAIIPAGMLTVYRTAAVSAYATEILHNKPIETLGIIGPGKINKAYTKWVINNYPELKMIKIKGRGKGSIESFVMEIKQHKPMLELKVCESFEESVVNSDVVSINTGFEFHDVTEMPYIKGKWIKSGALLNCSAFVKLSDSFIKGKAYVVADNYEMYESYAHELGYPVYNHLSFLGNRYVDLVHTGQLLREHIYDLKNIKENYDTELPILFASGGMAIEDIAVGYDIYKRALDSNIGTYLDC